MYEQNRVSIIGRIIWAIVSLLVLAALVWLVLWLLFWRHPKVDKVVDTTKQVGSNAAQSTKNAIEKGLDTAKKPTSPSTSTNTTTNTSGSGSSTTSTGTTTTNGTTSQTNGTSSAGSTTTTTTTTTPQTSSTNTQVPGGALAKTGPADAFVPIALAVAGGTIFYHVRLRRQSQQ